MVTEMTNSLNSSHFLSNWMLVMLVTFTEAYLQDILSLIISSGIQVRSLPPAIADEIKNKWTRNIREGGPRIWVRQLKRLGATGYRRDLVPRMKKIWVRRHEIVHSAAEIDNTAMQEFISATKVVNEFVETTDQFVVTSCP